VAYINGFGFELCYTDGTPAGTKLAYDINKGNWTSYPDRFTPRDSSLFFVARMIKKVMKYFLYHHLSLQHQP
jgi:ELWxxDGT repeat protein